jgi:hypothetical protein
MVHRCYRNPKRKRGFHSSEESWLGRLSCGGFRARFPVNNKAGLASLDPTFKYTVTVVRFTHPTNVEDDAACAASIFFAAGLEYRPAEELVKALLRRGTFLRGDL